ncbi:MAG: hypothetical protein AAFZ15_27920 [Bacteroidota bacterium]
MSKTFNTHFSINRIILWLVLFLILSTCSTPPTTQYTSLINTAHLDHLYEEVTMDGQQVGAIWIYSEAPDYQLVTDVDEGFTCIDDVARALVFYCRHYLSDSSLYTLERIYSLTDFLLHMQAENGYFYNFLLPGPQVNMTHQNSKAIPNWWSWRAFWALSEVGLLEATALSDLQSRCRPVMDTLLAKMQLVCSTMEGSILFEGIESPACLADFGADQIAVMMLGLANYYRKQPNEAVKKLLTRLGNLLLEVQQGNDKNPPHYAFLSWRNYWHAWGNSQAHALLYVGRILKDEQFITAGLNEVKYFYPYCLEKGFLSGLSMSAEDDLPIVKEVQSFPQIAYGMRPMINASLEAYDITGDLTFAETAGHLATWFFGNNPADQVMYDSATGRTFDGIGSSTSINRNSGAESTIEGLLSLQAVEVVPAARRVVTTYRRKRTD